MNDRIRLEKRGLVEVTVDDVLYTEEGWVSLGEMWAWFMPATGREFMADQSVLGPIGEEKAVFRVHYRESLRQVDRLVHLGRGGNRVWNIRSVVPVRFKEATDIHATTADDEEPAS